jgi:plasmid maintenance system antidote protein VapI
MRPPTNPFHPGEVLREEFLHPAGITQTAFARQLGWTAHELGARVLEAVARSARYNPTV